MLVLKHNIKYMYKSEEVADDVDDQEAVEEMEEEGAIE